MQHKNTTLEIGAAAIDEMAAMVLELPGIEIASEMLALKELHLADYQESKRLEELVKSMGLAVTAARRHRDELKADYDRTFDKVKSAEDHAFGLLMNHRQVSDYRAEFRGKLGAEAMKAVKAVLMASNEKYQGWVNRLGDLNERMGEIDRTTAKSVGNIKEYEDESKRLFASSEDLFKQIQALRERLN